MAMRFACGPMTTPRHVVPVDISGAWSRADHLQLGSGINSSFVEEFEIGMQTGDAVRIDAAQVGTHQHIGCLCGILLAYPEVKKHASAEFTQNFDGKNLCLRAFHILTCLAGSVCA